jgi:parvulin-like peptidyl-prolyl isomerase
MKKNIMPLENKMLFYVIVVIAILNVIAYLSVKDWNSLIFFFLAGFVAHAFQLGKTLSLIVAILSANIFRATKIMREGLETKKKKKQPEPEPDEKKIDYASNLKEPETFKSLEGLANKADNLVRSQENLQMMTKKLGPMMDKAMKLMDRLPKGFLEKA